MIKAPAERNAAAERPRGLSMSLDLAEIPAGGEVALWTWSPPRRQHVRGKAAEEVRAP